VPEELLRSSRTKINHPLGQTLLHCAELNQKLEVRHWK
jgi:hypothetical protein